jgi:hypothetical protein
VNSADVGNVNQIILVVAGQAMAKKDRHARFGCLNNCFGQLIDLRTFLDLMFGFFNAVIVIKAWFKTKSSSTILEFLKIDRYSDR